MDYEIEPRIGLRRLPFGSSKEAVREFFGLEPRVFQRTPESNQADYWPALGAFAYYDDEHSLEALEFAASTALVLKGTRLASMTMVEAKAFLSSLDPDLVSMEQGTSLVSHSLAVSFWCPTPDEPDAKVESVLLFRPGYLN